MGGGTERTRLRRLPGKAVTDRAVLHAILDAGRVAHVGIDGPFVLPVGYARDGDRVLIHGSTGSRLFRALAAGAPACFALTILDGLVLARSGFESSMNYRSVVAFGAFTELAGEEKTAGLRRLTEHLSPGRWEAMRPPLPKELAATLVLALPLAEWSVKVSDDWPHDAEEDRAWPVWAGVVPIVETLGEPMPDPGDPAAPPPSRRVGPSPNDPAP